MTAARTRVTVDEAAHSIRSVIRNWTIYRFANKDAQLVAAVRKLVRMARAEEARRAR